MRSVIWSAILALALSPRLNAAPLQGEDPQHAAAYADQWRQIATLPNFWEGTWQGVTPIGQGVSRAQLTPQLKQKIDAAKKAPTPSEFAQGFPYVGCQNPGMPVAMMITYMPIKFTAMPGMILVYIEGFNSVRFLHTDGRRHSGHLNPSYFGESIAHWEGDTLVVDSTGFVNKTKVPVAELPPDIGGPGETAIAKMGPPFVTHGTNLRIVERMHLTDFNTLEIKATFYDDTVYAQPLTLTMTFHRHTGIANDPGESICVEDPRDE